MRADFHLPPNSDASPFAALDNWKWSSTASADDLPLQVARLVCFWSECVRLDTFPFPADDEGQIDEPEEYEAYCALVYRVASLVAEADVDDTPVRLVIRRVGRPCNTIGLALVAIERWESKRPRAEIVVISKKNLLKALDISSSTLRDRLKRRQIVLAGSHQKYAKTVSIDLSQFPKSTQVQIRNKTRPAATKRD